MSWLQTNFCFYGICKPLDKHVHDCHKFTPLQIVAAKLRGTLSLLRHSRKPKA
jgi:hypothetical protein